MKASSVIRVEEIWNEDKKAFRLCRAKLYNVPFSMGVAHRYGIMPFQGVVVFKNLITHWATPNNLL